MKGLRIEVQKLAQAAQELGRAVETDWRLQIGLLQGFAEHPPELAVQADVDVRVDQASDLAQVAAQREDHVDLGADAFDQTPDFGQVGRRVEHAVGRADDVDSWLCAFRPLLCLRQAALLGAVLAPEPLQGTVRALPLIFVDGARQEALDAGAFGRDAAADHLGDGAGDDHGRQVGVERLVRPPHRVLGAGLAPAPPRPVRSRRSAARAAARRRCSAAPR